MLLTCHLLSTPLVEFQMDKSQLKRKRFLSLRGSDAVTFEIIAPQKASPCWLSVDRIKHLATKSRCVSTRATLDRDKCELKRYPHFVFTRITNNLIYCVFFNVRFP